MDWILIGIVAGSIVVSGHPSREACEGRAVMLREQKVVAKCVEMPKLSNFTINGTGMWCGDGSGLGRPC